MTEATQIASKKIVGAPMKLYRLSSVSDTNTLTTTFGSVKSVFISTYDIAEPGLANYVSYTLSGGTITFETLSICNMDVLVWGE